MNNNFNYKSSEKDRQRSNEYYQKNKTKCLKQRQEYYTLHKEEILKKEKIKRKSLEYGMIKREYDKQRYKKNMEKIRKRSNIYYHNNKDKRKNYLLKINYGITLDDYKNKWNEQKGECAICNRKFQESDILTKTHSLVVDHNHFTNQIRGLLCNSCNRALGLFKDDNTLIQSASKYLTKWNSNYASQKCNQS